MKVLVIGANGQVGKDLCIQLKERNHQCISCDIAGNVDFIVDGTNCQELLKCVTDVKPDAIVNCAAWTAVDAAEEESNKEKVYALNVTLVKNLVIAAKQVDCKLLHISTDYVFDGQGDEPWKPDDKQFGPLSYYGKTKLLGELEAEKLTKVFIVRIAWLFGGPISFVNTMLKLADKYQEVRVVNDQIGTPTYSKDLCRLLIDMIETEKYGYYHASNEGGYISWYDFCKEIYKQSHKTTRVIPVSTKEYGLSKAMRPYNSRLDKSKLSENGFERLPDYKDALSRYLSSLKDIQ